MKISTNAVLPHCTSYHFRSFFQLTLELVLILFTANTGIVMLKKGFIFQTTITYATLLNL